MGIFLSMAVILERRNDVFDIDDGFLALYL